MSRRCTRIQQSSKTARSSGLNNNHGRSGQPVSFARSNNFKSQRFISVFLSKHHSKSFSTNSPAIRDIHTSKLNPSMHPWTLLYTSRRRPELKFSSYYAPRMISREQLSIDLDNDLLQDAMAIVHFPTTCITPHDEYETTVALHMAKWSRRQFPNPLVTENRIDIVKLGGLFRRLHKYMSDYMAKATSPSIARAYLCLDNVSKGRSHSRYAHKPFNLNGLNYDEKKRLLQTFLRYELFYKVEHPRVKAEGVTERIRFLAVKGGNRLQKWDLEGIRCVHEYVRSLYGAVLAHCSGVHRPEPEVRIASRASHWHFNPDLYGFDLELPGIYTHNTPMLADFGFELISTLINVATRGEKGRQKAIKWFKLFVNETEPTLKRSILFPGGLALNFDRPRTREKDFEKTPGVCQKLFAAIRSQEWLGSAYEPSEAALRRSVFRQRAWFLLDDSRLYPRPRLSHFPLKQHMKNHSRKKSLCTQFSQTRL